MPENLISVLLEYMPFIIAILSLIVYVLKQFKLNKFSFDVIENMISNSGFQGLILDVFKTYPRNTQEKTIKIIEKRKNKMQKQKGYEDLKSDDPEIKKYIDMISKLYMNLKD